MSSQRITKILQAAFSAIGITGSVIAAAAFVPGVWLCDIASQLRLVQAVLLLICLAILFLLRSRIGTVIVLVGILANAFPIVSLYLPAQCISREKSQTISILNFNTEFQHNNRYDLLQNLLVARNPDVLVLVEVNKKWINGIEPTTRRYPTSFQNIVR